MADKFGFAELLEDCSSKGTKLKTDDYLLKGKYAIVDQGQQLIAGYTDIEDGVYTDIPAIIFGDHTRVVKYVDVPFFLGADGTKLLKAKKTGANYKYLYYALKAAHIPNTGYNRHFKWVKELEFNYPSVEEQMKIVDLLDRLQLLMDKRNRQLEELDTLIKARFVEMFGDIHNSKIYPYLKIVELTTVMSGGTPSREHSEYWDGGTIGWVKTTELQNNELYDSEEKITELGLNNSSAKMVPENTILIAMYGQGKTRGMTAYLKFATTTNQACACILPSDKIDSKYLWYYMIFSYEKLRSLAKGGNQPNLNGNMIKSFPVLLPDRKLQEEFVTFACQVDKLKVVVQDSLNEARTLFDSLMQEYFG